MHALDTSSLCKAAIDAQGTWLTTLTTRIHGRGGVKRICDINMQDSAVAMALLCIYRRAQYLGVDYRRTNLSERVSGLPHPISRRVTVISSLKPNVWSVRALPSRWRKDGCDILLVGMDAPSARLRESLVFDLPNALSLSRSYGPSVVVLRGNATCQRADWVGDIYYGPYWRVFHERCWVGSFFDLLRYRDLVRGDCDIGDGGTSSTTISASVQRSCFAETPPVNLSVCQRRVPFFDAARQAGVLKRLRVDLSVGPEATTKERLRKGLDEAA